MSLLRSKTYATIRAQFGTQGTPMDRETDGRLIVFARILASYGCVRIEQTGGQPCGECGPCEAWAWLCEHGYIQRDTGSPEARKCVDT
jgi:hypothetical protein